MNQDMISIMMTREEFEDLQYLLRELKEYAVYSGTRAYLARERDTLERAIEIKKKIECWARNLNNLANFD